MNGQDQERRKANTEIFELCSTSKSTDKKGFILKNKRMLVGNSEVCDIVLPFLGISGIHAVLEIKTSDSMALYDMNSKFGTYINGKQVVSQDFKVGDKLKFGNHEFIFKKFDRRDVLPPVLEMLDPMVPDKIEVAPPVDLPKPPTKKLPKLESLKRKNVFSKKEVPRIEYPLAKDPKAEFSEYIFEDTDTLYPIFHYEVDSKAIEVIIIFKDKIFSVDYLPVKKSGQYTLVGKFPKKADIEYPYLGTSEKVPFINVESHNITVEKLHGYETMLLGEQGATDTSSMRSIHLEQNDIIRFYKDNLQIFVRGTESPPSTDFAPIISRDKDLRKYIILMMIFMTVFIFSMEMFEVDTELDKEKAPERIATILYKKHLYRKPKKKTIIKTKKARKVVQKAPVKKVKKKVTKATVPKVVQKATVKKATVKTVQPKKRVTKVKKATPKKAPTVTRKKTVTTSTKRGGSKKPTKARAPQRSRARAASKGHVDTYKSFDFKSSVSALLSKGGQLNKAKIKVAKAYDPGETSIATGGQSATIKRAKISHNIGSLTGAASGKLDTSKGMTGIVNKKSIYTVGLPSSEVILGSMDPDVIRAILMDNIHHFRNCYQRVLRNSSTAFNGILPLNFVIGASGHITRAGVSGSTRKIPRKVQRCVINVLRGIKFPAPLGGGVVEVNQPMNLYTK
ncbi:MAG: FHA domain-containing protein [Bacteriovoracaceae bacterium]|nr:FHA domain-containing protein [Bacteriovoracaceae bacterium]